MASWIHLFAQFTQEALLFESLAILLLCTSYAAFWVLRKRRLGAVKDAVPVGVVKGYLNELIRDAESLRAQLFGLLGANGVPMSQLSQMMSASEPSLAMAQAAQIAAAAVQNPTEGVEGTADEKVAILEKKMTEQAQAMQTILQDKARIEKELADAKAASSNLSAGATGPSTGGGNDAEMDQLKQKIAELEGKLAEYSVIEDDLANLKRLQQENAQLKSKLNDSGGTVSEAPAADAVIAAAESAAEFTEKDNQQAASAPEAQAAPEATPAAPTEAAPADAAPTEAAPEASDPLSEAIGADASFDSLVDQVEQSLQPDAPAPAAEEAPAGATAAASTSQPDGDTIGQSDADLVAEFEKMLR